MKLKQIITFAAFFSAVQMGFCGEFTESEKQMINGVMEFRFKTRSFSSADEAISETKKYHESLLEEDIQSQLGDEAKLVVDNLLVLQQYDYIYEKDADSPELEPFIVAQYEKIAAWNETHDVKSSNPYYILSSGDLINSTMRFLQQSQAIKLGLQEKKDYDYVVEAYPDLSFGFINTALWYYFAPAIGGGSTAKASRYFQRAVECAQNSYEKFYSCVYYSQFLYEKDDAEGCEKYLSEAEKMLPGSRYLSLIRRMNKIGYSVLDYSNNRQKIDAKLEKKGV